MLLSQGDYKDDVLVSRTVIDSHSGTDSGV